LRAIKIPAGTHKVEFRFLPKSYVLGKTLALITSLLLFVLAIVAIVAYFKQRGIVQDELVEPAK